MRFGLLCGVGLMVLLANAAPVKAEIKHQKDFQKVHVIEKRLHAASGRHEVSLFMGTSMNDKFVGYYMLPIAYTYHIRESLAFTFMPIFPIQNTVTGLTTEIQQKVNLKPVLTDLRIVDFLASDGKRSPIPILNFNFQWSPLYGKVSLFEKYLSRFDLYILAGGGVAGTRLNIDRLQDEEADDACSSQEHGGGNMEVIDGNRECMVRTNKFVANLGGGFRFWLSDLFTFKIELRNMFFSDRQKELDISDGHQGATNDDISNVMIFMLGVSAML